MTTTENTGSGTAAAVNPPRQGLLGEVVSTFTGLGGIPLVICLFVPRASISFAVVLIAMMCRAVARVVGTASTYEKKANLRILIITDYMPPQTHGIAVRFQQYIETMRRMGHEVQVFSTNITKERETSFDHPNLPAIQNPFNRANKMAYNPGLKLAWFLGSKQLDLVHLVFPTNISLAVLPVCNWRRIPVYCSHHVDMEYYVGQYVAMRPVAELGHLIYWLMVKLPAMCCGHTNAAPTLCFLDSHLPAKLGSSTARDPRTFRRRIPSGVADARFRVDSVEQLVEERRELLRLIGADPAGKCCVCIMVQRLAIEKDTIHALEALNALRSGLPSGSPKLPFSLDGKRAIHFVLAGDGPARRSLEAYVAANALPATFLGNLSNDRLPPLYRAADVFVTCSTSETFGLTVLEALACGTPAVMPTCTVFNELWTDTVPKEWIYTHKSVDPTTSVDSLLAAIASAGMPAAKEQLRANPVKASWADATKDLLTQYEECINANLPYRQELASYTSVFNQLARVALVAWLLWWLTRIELKFVIRLILEIIE